MKNRTGFAERVQCVLDGIDADPIVVRSDADRAGVLSVRDLQIHKIGDGQRQGVCVASHAGGVLHADRGVERVGQTFRIDAVGGGVRRSVLRRQRIIKPADVLRAIQEFQQLVIECEDRIRVSIISRAFPQVIDGHRVPRNVRGVVVRFHLRDVSPDVVLLRLDCPCQDGCVSRFGCVLEERQQRFAGVEREEVVMVRRSVGLDEPRSQRSLRIHQGKNALRHLRGLLRVLRKIRTRNEGAQQQRIAPQFRRIIVEDVSRTVLRFAVPVPQVECQVFPMQGKELRMLRRQFRQQPRGHQLANGIVGARFFPRRRVPRVAKNTLFFHVVRQPPFHERGAFLHFPQERRLRRAG